MSFQMPIWFRNVAFVALVETISLLISYGTAIFMAEAPFDF